MTELSDGHKSLGDSLERRRVVGGWVCLFGVGQIGALGQNVGVGLVCRSFYELCFGLVCIC